MHFQDYIKQNILENTHDLSTPLDVPGREWSPGIDYVILGDKPINKVIPGQKQRSLVFLIKHLKTGRKLVLKVGVGITSAEDVKIGKMYDDIWGTVQ